MGSQALKSHGNGGKHKWDMNNSDPTNQIWRFISNLKQQKNLRVTVFSHQKVQLKVKIRAISNLLQLTFPGTAADKFSLGQTKCMYTINYGHLISLGNPLDQ